MKYSDKEEEFSSCCPPGSLGALPKELLNAQGPLQGKIQSIEEATTSRIRCYHTVSPEVASSSSKALIIFPDIWNFESRILSIADCLANSSLGCHVVVVDFFDGTNKDDHDDMKTWFTSMPYRPVIRNKLLVVKHWLRTNFGVMDEVGAMGFCWGGWAIAKCCEDIDWKVAVGAHPSFKIETWVFEGDEQELLKGMPCPTMLLPASNDSEYTHPGSPTMASMRHPASKSILFPHQKHGFMTRGGDYSDRDSSLRRDIDAALESTIDFVRQHL